MYHYEFVAEDGNDSLLSIDDFQEPTALVKLREDPVSLIIKDPYSRDGKSHNDLEDFKWVAE